MKKSKFIMILEVKGWLFKHKLKIISKIFDILCRIFAGCDIPASVKFGKNLNLPHFGLGVLIHPRCEIGDNCKIYHHVTIGYRNNDGPPKIGSNCMIGAGACILGNIKIGNNVLIGANAVVLTDVPDNSVAVGVPAIIKQRGANG